jgi:BMFP domain-containing protein YqiC
MWGEMSPEMKERMEKARAKFKEMEERIAKLEAEVAELKAAK